MRWMLLAMLIGCGGGGNWQPVDLTGRWTVVLTLGDQTHPATGCVLEMLTFHSGLWSCVTATSVPATADVGTQARSDSVTLHVLGEALEADVALSGPSDFAGFFWTTGVEKINGRIEGHRAD